MKGEEPADVRERIITSCMEVIEREGIEGRTVRAIAEEARMNVAAIDHYFRSKDRLLEEVLRRTLGFGLDPQPREISAAIAAEGGDVGAGLARLLQSLGMATTTSRMKCHATTALRPPPKAGQNVGKRPRVGVVRPGGSEAPNGEGGPYRPCSGEARRASRTAAPTRPSNLTQCKLCPTLTPCQARTGKPALRSSRPRAGW
ncbi:TetR/AcrR family transcriptional regulator [Sorangium sp. So ce291]|uniref:TetR/AcrR family transcriptional regulator n=1 Tax=Sorangium sp. So ce291 TaxID=3133294 RepID=UPI003F6221DA